MTDKGRRATILLAILSLVVFVGCSKGAAPVGEAGDPSDVDRVVDIETTNELRFDPSEIDAEVGETIEFKIMNVASSEHEFVLGSVTHEHEEGMDHSNSNATGPIQPGDSASVIWHFTEGGEIEFACHIAGHDKSGMTGTVSISE